MDLSAVMTEIDTRLKTITGLAVHLGIPGKLGRVPAVVQYLPERIDFDGTYGRGSDYYEVMVVVFVGRQVPRQAIADVAPYVAGSGAKSIKAKLDMSSAAPYAACSDVVVESATFDAAATYAGNEYLAALFTCKIIGPGA